MRSPEWHACRRAAAGIPAGSHQRSGNLFVLLHAIEKTTRIIPAADIAIEGARFADF
jgi:hypothetical protein